MPDRQQPRVAFVQDGSRLHYAVPIALERAGLLERVFCDWWAPPGSFAAAIARTIGWLKPGLSQKLAARFVPGLPAAKLKSAPLLALRTAAARKRFSSDEAFWEWQSARIGQWIEGEGFGAANLMGGFVRNVHPRLWRAAKERGLLTVGDQICAPAQVEQAQYEKETARWPAWANPGAPPSFRDAGDMEAATWPLLDRITCASEWVKSGLVGQAIAPERIAVIPYPLDIAEFTPAERSKRSGPVAIGCVARVSLAKGAPYFAAVAKRLKSAGVRFVIVGPVLVPEAVRSELSGVELAGGVPRGEVARRLAEFDAFYFPSTSEGSAGAVMEAMATGLPIVCSPQSGSIVKDGVEGFIVPYDDLDATCAKLEQLIRQPELRLSMGRAARAAAERLSIDRYAAAWQEMAGALVHHAA